MGEIEVVDVALGDRSYPIHIGLDLLAKADMLEEHIVSKQVLIVSNETVAPLYLAQLLDQLKTKFNVSTAILPDGEKFKTLEYLALIYDALLQNRCNRQVTLIALGGGVIGDMTGFAAASYQRGVNFIQIPTTLLSQVDSSVGGKTGVNHPLGKNMIGAFYQPQCVLIDTTVLNSLPDRELSAGLAEVIKYGAICDELFFQWLEQNMDALVARDSTALSYAIKTSCEKKAEVVSKDERESGIRATLNFGHTFGHAIETDLGYGEWLHGEAVSVGMCVAAELSTQLGWLKQDDNLRIKALCQRAGLPVDAPKNMVVADFIKHMKVDKKNINSAIRLVLLQELGEAVIYDCTDEGLIDAAITNYRTSCS